MSTLLLACSIVAEKAGGVNFLRKGRPRVPAARLLGAHGRRRVMALSYRRWRSGRHRRGAEAHQAIVTPAMCRLGGEGRQMAVFACMRRDVNARNNHIVCCWRRKYVMREAALGGWQQRISKNISECRDICNHHGMRRAVEGMKPRRRVAAAGVRVEKSCALAVARALETTKA